jgi:hypothetical protein
MTTLMSLSGPFEMGLKPKNYFEATKVMTHAKLIRSSAIIKGKAYDVSHVKKSHTVTPFNKELMIVLPWVITGTVILMNMIF